jgi:phenylacetate-CoA ligase
LKRQQKIRYGNYYKSYLLKFQRNWQKNEQDLKSVQEIQLSKILIEAYYCTLFYRNNYKGLLSNSTVTALKTNPSLSLKVLDSLPLISKSQLIAANKDSWNNMRKLVYLNHTSGTTGTPAAIPYDDESFQIGFALWRRFHDNIGLPENFKSVRISGKLIVAPFTQKPPFWVYNFADKQLFMSSYHLTEKNLRAYVQKLNSFSPEFIDAYPSALYIIAEYINRHNIELLFTPIAIATTAETLFDYQKQAIENAFKCKVYNQYSSSEGGPFITECTSGKFHLNTDSAVFELFKDDNKIFAGEGIAELVVSSFRQWMFPLIRYRTGDFVKYDANAFKFQTCECGCSMPYVLEILGREDDILFTREKGWVGRLDTAYKGLDGIKASSIIQHSIDEVTVNIVPESYYDAKTENALIENLKFRLGNEITFTVNIIDKIPVGPNGKIKSVHRNFKV